MRSYAQQKSAGRSAVAIGIVCILQLGVLYGVLRALDVQFVTKAKQDVDTKIIEEVKPPPPPDVPPPPPPPPNVPPPAFIPPPEIIINTPAPPAVVTAPTTVAPPVSAPVQHTEAPTAPPVQDTSASARPIAGPPLQFPARMRDSGREGSVDVACDVETDGSTNNCEILTSQGGSAFTDAALDYVKHAKYKPATHNGQPVKESHHRWTITFKLNG